MGTKLEPGMFDCHTKAQSDEPIFTLLARDPLAHVLVDLWASLAHKHKPEKIKEAKRVAQDMRDWHAKNVVVGKVQTQEDEDDFILPAMALGAVFVDDDVAAAAPSSFTGGGGESGGGGATASFDTPDAVDISPDP